MEENLCDFIPKVVDSNKGEIQEEDSRSEEEEEDDIVEEVERKNSRRYICEYEEIPSESESWLNSSPECSSSLSLRRSPPTSSYQESSTGATPAAPFALKQILRLLFRLVPAVIRPASSYQESSTGATPAPLRSSILISSNDMWKIVLKLDYVDTKKKIKVLKVVASMSGSMSAEFHSSVDRKDKNLTVIGNLDAVEVVSKLRKVCRVDLLSISAE